MRSIDKALKSDIISLEMQRRVLYHLYHKALVPDHMAVFKIERQVKVYVIEEKKQ